jgi:hypothetical protein
MRKILDYVIITSSKGVETLESLIKENIRLGWQPLGGVTAINMATDADEDEVKQVFAQAMVKYDS